MKKYVQRIRAGLLVSTVAACSSPTGPEASLAEAQQRWTSKGVPDYSWVVYRSCECLQQMSGPTRVIVRNGEVEARWFIPGGEPTADQYAELFPSVEGLFQLISHHLAHGTPIVEATYDSAFGYPVRVAIGWPNPDGVVVYQTSDFSGGLN